MNKNWPLWRKMITYIGSVIVGIFTIIGAIYTVRGFYATANQPAPKTTQPNPQNQRTELSDKKPVKRNGNNSVHIEKSPIVNSVIQPTTIETTSADKTSVVQNMKDSPGSLQIGVNKAPVTYNAAPPVKPIDERLRNLLNEIDPEILKTINSGYGGVKVMIPPHQHALLSNMCAEKGADQYIKIMPFAPDDPVQGFGPKGALLGINLRIYPKLIGK